MCQPWPKLSGLAVPQEAASLRLASRLNAEDMGLLFIGIKRCGIIVYLWEMVV